jgi:hypothetical protein
MAADQMHSPDTMLMENIINALKKVKCLYVRWLMAIPFLPFEELFLSYSSSHGAE